MNEQDGPPSESGTDRTGSPLPPGAGSPVQPGPPMSVQAPIKDTTINMVALVLGFGAVILVIIVVLVLIVAFAHR